MAIMMTNDIEWKMVKLGDVTQVFSGGTPSTDHLEYWNGNIPWMNSGELNLKIVNAVEGRITELGLGFSEEGGEVIDIIRKTINGGYNQDEIDYKHLTEELGDVIWYITHILMQTNSESLERITRKNLAEMDVNSNIENDTEMSIEEYQQKMYSSCYKEW